MTQPMGYWCPRCMTLHEEETACPEQGGHKNDSGKSPMGLLPRYSLEQVAEVLGFGAGKYGKSNWRSGIAVQRNLDAALRHIYAANECEDCDPESGLPHLAHAVCDLLFVIETLRAHPECDDRYNPAE